MKIPSQLHLSSEEGRNCRLLVLIAVGVFGVPVNQLPFSPKAGTAVCSALKN